MLRLAPSLLLLQQLYNANSLEITLSGDAPFQIYDGHGGLSAGASSRLLLDYNEPQRSEVLDYLYKPNFGANLHMCKIEIGGDTQSTDGTEPSYKHYREEPPVCGVNRGYEMWLLSEANKRNPDVQSFLLSWGVPNWVGNGTFFSEENIEYQVRYAKCVQETIGGNHPHYGMSSCLYIAYLQKRLLTLILIPFLIILYLFYLIVGVSIPTP